MSDQSRVGIFVSYAPEDQRWGKRIHQHLYGLEHYLKYAHIWLADDIEVGSNRADVINRRLNMAQIILLLISANYFSSDYCYDVIMTRALERARRGEAIVIPILIYKTDIKDAFPGLSVWPKNGKPVNSHWLPDKALAEIAASIRLIIEEMRAPN